MNWTKQKPNVPCVFVTREKWNAEYEYAVWQIRKLDAADDDTYYLGLLEGNGEEWGALEDLEASEYFVIEELDK